MHTIQKNMERKKKGAGEIYTVQAHNRSNINEPLHRRKRGAELTPRRHRSAQHTLLTAHGESSTLHRAGKACSSSGPVLGAATAAVATARAKVKVDLENCIMEER